MSGHDQSELDHLKEKMRRMIYLFSHDMRNPLVNMKALLNEVHLSLQNVKKGDVQALDRELPDTMQMLGESVERMSAMVDGANDIYHCMFDPLECEAVELKPLVERVLHRFGDVEGVEVRVEDMAMLWADPLAVGRIVEALLKNSLQATGSKGPVIVSLQQYSDFDALMVTDFGGGIPDVTLERMFDPFYSGPEQQKRAAAGMGLTVVKALAEAHGGSVRCELVSGEGVVFCVSFPHQAE